MDTTKLRIGNIVNAGSFGTGVIEAINGRNKKEHRIITLVISERNYRFKENKLNPVLLTDKILINFGFTASCDNFGGWLSPSFEGGRLRISNVFTWFNGCWTTKITYVHQLQNLFCSLTEEELVFNPAKSS